MKIQKIWCVVRFPKNPARSITQFIIINGYTNEMDARTHVIQARQHASLNTFYDFKVLPVDVVVNPKCDVL